MIKSLTAPDTKEIAELYRSGMTSSQIRKFFENKIDWRYVFNALEVENIKIRHGRQKIWNYDFFKNQNPISCYWAGFALADAHIRNNNSIIFQLSIEDKAHLERFCADIGLNEKVSLRNRNGNLNTCVVSVTDKELKDQLINYGLHHNKTHQFIAPKINSYILKAHYIRGMIDGDGCIYVNYNSKNNLVAVLSINGNLDSLYWVKRQLTDMGYKGSCIVKRLETKTPKLRYGVLTISGHKNLLHINEILFGNDELSLKRKWSKIDTIKEHVKNKVNKKLLKTNKTKRKYHRKDTAFDDFYSDFVTY